MALRQTRNLLRKQAINANWSGGMIVQTYPIELTTGLLAADVLEVAVLPAGAKLHRVDFVSTGIASAATIDVGILSGAAMDVDNARVMPATAEIINDGVRNTTISVGPVALDALGLFNGDRGIGIKFSIDEVAGAGKSAKLFVSFYKP